MAVSILFYREGIDAPALDWLDEQPPPVRRVFTTRFELIEEHGFRLERPHVAPLGNGLHEIRVGRQHVNYRIIFCFYGRTAVLLTHGFTKEREVPEIEITRALGMKQQFDNDPEHHYIER